MNMTQAIYEHICKHPGVTNNEVAAALKLNATRVAALTGQMCKPTAKYGPRLRRETHPSLKAPGQQPIYMHFATDATVVLRERERTAPVSKRQSANIAPPALDGLIDAIAKQIAGRIVEGVGRHLAVQLSVILPEAPEQQFDLVQYLKEAIVPPEQPKQEAVARLPRVTIVGLLPQQAGLISSEFGQAYDLSFWKEEGIDKLKSLVKSADHVITFSGKLPHHVENTIRSVNCEFKRVMGGMTELRRALNELSPA